jgi:hypothetical protein
MTELSPEDKAHVNRIVDRKMETMQREGAKLKSPMRAALGAIQQAEREEIRRQALREAAQLMAHFNEDEDSEHHEMIVKLRQYGRRERSAAILALIDAPATESAEMAALKENLPPIREAIEFCRQNDIYYLAIDAWCRLNALARTR